jgi:hypothetical protein
MPMNNADRDWVVEKISTAIQSQVAPQGWKKLRDHLPTAAICTIAIALLSLTAAGWNYAFTKVEARATFEANTGSKLTAVEGRLTAIEGSLAVLQARIVSQKLASAPQSDLKVHREEINAVRASLASTEDGVAGFWPSSFEIITLLSKATSTEVDFAKLASARESVFNDFSASGPGAVSPIVGMNVLLKNHIQGLTFRNSIIRFDPSVKLSNDVFVDCIFVFPSEQNPSGPLQQIGRTLLASDLENVTLNAS